MIYLVRHGKDDESYVGGWSNIDLTSKGREQIKRTALWFKENNIHVNNIFTSDITRAVSSAKIIADILKLDVNLDSNFRELNKGLLNGLSRDIAKSKYPEYINLKDINKKYPEGESLISFYERIKELLNKLDKYEHAIIVTHRGVINVIYFVLNNVELCYNKELFGVTHSSIHELDLKKKKIKKVGIK